MGKDFEDVVVTTVVVNCGLQTGVTDTLEIW